jgi:hypothetical protein
MKMKYFSKNQMDELRGIFARCPAVTVNLDHPSLVLFERIRHGNEAVIDLTEPSDIDPATKAKALIDKLNDLRFDDRVIDELDDERDTYETKSLVMNSKAVVNGLPPEGLVVVGTIRDLLPKPAPPKAEPKEPSQAEPL